MLILDGEGRYLLLRRARPGEPPYLVVPGGGLADGESLADAARRECFEELGATVTVGDVVFVTRQDEPAPGAVQRFLLARLEAIDDAARTGHEFEEPDRGSYETVRVAQTDADLAMLRPVEILELIRRRHASFVTAAAALR